MSKQDAIIPNDTAKEHFSKMKVSLNAEKLQSPNVRRLTGEICIAAQKLKEHGPGYSLRKIETIRRLLDELANAYDEPHQCPTCGQLAEVAKCQE